MLVKTTVLSSNDYYSLHHEINDNELVVKKCHFRRVMIKVLFVNITANQIQNKQEKTNQSEKKEKTSNYVNSFIYHYHPLHPQKQTNNTMNQAVYLFQIERNGIGLG